jgi:hypothetical protein
VWFERRSPPPTATGVTAEDAAIHVDLVDDDRLHLLEQPAPVARTVRVRQQGQMQLIESNEQHIGLRAFEFLTTGCRNLTSLDADRGVGIEPETVSERLDSLLLIVDEAAIRGDVEGLPLVVDGPFERGHHVREGLVRRGRCGNDRVRVRSDRLDGLDLVCVQVVDTLRGERTMDGRGDLQVARGGILTVDDTIVDWLAGVIPPLGKPREKLRDRWRVVSHLSNGGSRCARVCRRRVNCLGVKWFENLRFPSWDYLGEAVVSRGHSRGAALHLPELDAADSGGRSPLVRSEPAGPVGARWSGRSPLARSGPAGFGHGESTGVHDL